MSERRSKKEHWDRFWERSDHIEEVYSNEGRVTKHITAVVQPEGKRVLEVGAGSGRDGILLAHRGAFVVSLDYSLSSLSVVSSQIDEKDSLVLCCGDAFALPFEDKTFDIVFHQGLLEHFRNPDDMIAEHARVLRPGGYLLVDVPQRYHYYTVLKHIMILVGRWFAGWECEYSVGELERLLERHSFSVVTSYGEWFNPPIWYRILRKALFPRGVHLAMYPKIFTVFRRGFRGLRSYILKKRWALYTTLIIGTIARKE
ncbi:MAG: class I SAM-dependent methyltransferase [Candidatus Krumholzibacteria bacterium]|nr:class I SAM-dependent methyltransferase [Candidatus Krumholzibacteria bacterium]